MWLLKQVQRCQRMLHFSIRKFIKIEIKTLHVLSIYVFFLTYRKIKFILCICQRKCSHRNTKPFHNLNDTSCSLILSFCHRRERKFPRSFFSLKFKLTQFSVAQMITQKWLSCYWLLWGFLSIILLCSGLIKFFYMKTLLLFY